jgi:hypothetical protein
MEKQLNFEFDSNKNLEEISWDALKKLSILLEEIATHQNVYKNDIKQIVFLSRWINEKDIEQLQIL